MGGLSIAEKKNKITEKLTNIYLSLKTFPETEEKFINIILDGLSQEETKYLKDEEIKNFFNQHISKLYNKMKENIEEKEDLRISLSCIYDDLLSTHKKEFNNLINSMSEENLKKQEENDIKLKQKLEEYDNKIKEIQNKNDEEKERLRYQSDLMQAEFKSRIEFLEKQIKDEKEEEKRKKYENDLKEAKEREKRKERLNKIFKEKAEKIKLNRLSEIEKEFESNKINFCKEEISKFDKKEISSFVKNFLNAEKVASFILDFLIQLVTINKKIVKDIEHLNIVLVGPSGVGKTTLINAVLNIDLKTGFGCPQTLKSEYFTSEKIPFLRLADSRGIEKNTTSGVDSIFENIKSFIQNQLKTKDFDKFVHIIWYRWSGTRFEQSERDLFEKISKQYSLENIPVIIVYTNAVFNNEIENARKFVKEDLKSTNEFIDILALEKELDGKIIPSRNLDVLIQKSIELAKSAIKSSIYEGIISDVNQKITENIQGIIMDLKEQIKSKAKTFLEKNENNISLKDFHDNTKNIILNTLYKYFILTPNDKKEINLNEIPKIMIGNNEFKFSEESMQILNDFCFKYFDNILNIYQKNLEEFLNKYSKTLSQEIRIEKIELNSKNDNLLSETLLDTEYESVLKNELIQKLEKKARFTVLSNAFIYIIEPIILTIGDYFSLLYQKLMKKEKFIDCVRNLIKDCFSNIEKKINDYISILKTKKEKENIENENKGAAPSQNIEIGSDVNKGVNDLINDL